jgi:hypothetical protein
MAAFSPRAPAWGGLPALLREPSDGSLGIDIDDGQWDFTETTIRKPQTGAPMEVNTELQFQAPIGTPLSLPPVFGPRASSPFGSAALERSSSSSSLGLRSGPERRRSSISGVSSRKLDS